MQQQRCKCGGELVTILGRGIECRTCGAPQLPPKPSAPPVILALDVGQTTDYTALCGLELVRGPDHADPRRTVNHYALRQLFRLHLGTPYPEMVATIKRLACEGLLPAPPKDDTQEAQKKRAEAFRGCTLVVDQTGVGRPVVDMLRVAGMPVCIRPVTITAGRTASEDPTDMGFHVPKAELITTLQVVLQQRRVKWPDARKLPEVAVLQKELADFKVKITAAANETFNAREGAHDDLMLALALGVWVGERACVGPLEMGMSPRGHVVQRAPGGVFSARR